MKPQPLTSVLTIVACLNFAGCSSLLFNVADPSGGIPSNEIVKSLRCELVSYFAVNYQTALSFDELAREKRLTEAVENYPYLDIDRWQYAGIGVDLRDIDAVSAGFGLTRKSTSLAPAGSANAGNYRNFNFGPALALTSTYSRTQLYTLPQYAGIGPALAGKDSTYQIYAPQASADEGFFCYAPLPDPGMTSRETRLTDLQNLVDGHLPAYQRFRRIMVDGQLSLARWLQETGVAMARNRLTTVPTTENLFPGQLSYTFSLEIKPSLNVGYTLVATSISPFAPTGSASIDNTSTFSIFLNTKNAKLAFGSRSGAADLDAATRAAIPQTP